jgi:single-stranded-DNA-specific exonuclease
VPESAVAYAAEPYHYADVRAVADGLGLSEPVAVTLVRRGYRTPEQARAFLEADESHPPAAFGSMPEVVERVRATIAVGRRITVHGDFDVDGVCATAIMISTLRRLGAECDWFIPDRIADGYGVTTANVELLAQRGTKLLLTVDCGITAVEQVRLARELGMEVVVTDHHQPGGELPACPILHPSISGYPFEHLCGTAVAWKLSCALTSRAVLAGPTQQVGPSSTALDVASSSDSPIESDEADLDLVALATVADVVPLVGENRSLVRKGLAEMRRARRPGLRALMAAAKCEPSRLDEGDLSFRLAPRINAAGRLYRADAGVELLLTEDPGRAEQIAAELGRANSERRAAEREVDAAAEAARRELPDELRAASGLVLAGEGWHPGVVGIVASRLVERHHRPVVVVSLDGEGGGRGSGRGIPGFDLLAALEACSEHLESFGGHRAAAGLSLRAENLAAFQAAFAAHADQALGPEDLRRTERIDAMVGGVGLGLELAEELGRLAPFGMGNPGVRLMVPSARLTDVRTMGEGKHARFTLRSGSHRALGVAFGRSSLGVEEEDEVDASVRLEVNHWNGSVEPRVVLREVYPLGEAEGNPVGRGAGAPEEAGGADVEGGEGAGPAEGSRALVHPCRCEDDEWWQRFEAELNRDLAPDGKADLFGSSEQIRHERVVVPGSHSAIATVAELVSSGSGVLAICADASRRAELASGAAGLARFNGGSARIACSRCGAEAMEALAEKGSAGGLALTDYAALRLRRSEVAAAFEHVVLVDPPPSPAARALAGLPAAESAKGALVEHLSRTRAGDVVSGGGADGGFLHLVWTEAERRFAESTLEAAAPSRQAIAGVFRALRQAGAASGAALREALSGTGPHPLAPETAARCFRVLGEVDLVRGEPNRGEGSVIVVSSERTELERSAAFRRYSEEHAEARRFLARPKQP